MLSGALSGGVNMGMTHNRPRSICLVLSFLPSSQSVPRSHSFASFSQSESRSLVWTLVFGRSGLCIGERVVQYSVTVVNSHCRIYCRGHNRNNRIACVLNTCVYICILFACVIHASF